MAGAGLARSNSSKSLHRSNSRANSIISPNYSDISDASDADMDTSQQEVLPGVVVSKAVPGDGGGGGQRAAEMTEDRLYCNEELHSPGQSRDAPAARGDKEHAATTNQRAAAAPGSGDVRPRSNSSSRQSGVSGRQSVPLHAAPPPPQHIMYPYFPFLPTSQLGGAPVSGAPPPMYAPPPYFMTYQGFPVMQGGLPPHVPGAPAFVAAVSGAGPPPHSAPSHVARSKPS